MQEVPCVHRMKLGPLCSSDSKMSCWQNTGSALPQTCWRDCFSAVLLIIIFSAIPTSWTFSDMFHIAKENSRLHVRQLLWKVRWSNLPLRSKIRSLANHVTIWCTASFLPLHYQLSLLPPFQFRAWLSYVIFLVYYSRFFLVPLAVKITFHLTLRNLPAMLGTRTHQSERTPDENELVGFGFLFLLLKYFYLYTLTLVPSTMEERRFNSPSTSCSQQHFETSARMFLGQMTVL